MIRGVAELYDHYASYQWSRLDAFPCELHIHLAALRQHLEPGSRILDIGAGPGRYSLLMAQAGHRVLAADLSPVQVELARQHLTAAGFPPGAPAAPGAGSIEAAEVLDVLELGSWQGSNFDAVIAFGPFYHLKDPASRHRAASHIARLLRPGGKVFATFMPRTYWLSMALHTFITTPDAPAAQLAALEKLLAEGRLEKVRSPQLQQSYFSQLDEIAPLWAACGIRQQALLASSGVTAVWSRPETWADFAKRPPELQQRLYDLVLATAADPGVLGMSDQVLFIGEKEA